MFVITRFVVFLSQIYVRNAAEFVFCDRYNCNFDKREKRFDEMIDRWFNSMELLADVRFWGRITMNNDR